MEALILAGTPFLLNAVMTVAKALGAQDMSRYGLRALLALFSLLGAIAASALSGQSPDMSHISDLIQVILLAFVNFLAAHSSYDLFWKK